MTTDHTNQGLTRRNCLQLGLGTLLGGGLAQGLRLRAEANAQTGGLGGLGLQGRQRDRYIHGDLPGMGERFYATGCFCAGPPPQATLPGGLLPGRPPR